VDEHDQRNAHHEAHGLEVADNIVRKLAVEMRADTVRRHRRLEQGVAVGIRLCDEVGRDDTGGAAAVIDDHRLPECIGELLADRARDDVRRAARRETDENAYRSSRIVCGSCGAHL